MPSWAVDLILALVVIVAVVGIGGAMLAEELVVREYNGYSKAPSWAHVVAAWFGSRFTD